MNKKLKWVLIILGNVITIALAFILIGVMIYLNKRSFKRNLKKGLKL